MEHWVRKCRPTTTHCAGWDHTKVSGLPVTLLFEDYEHASAVHQALVNETHDGRVWTARHLLSKEGGHDIWDGNALWLTVDEMRALLDGNVPESTRARVLAKYRERDEQWTALFEKPPKDALGET